MFQALLRGKLSRDQENMEDILTSNVFGVFKYLPPERALFPFLSKAKSLEGKNLSETLFPNPKIEYEFWPWLEEAGCNGCEPDVRIDLTWPNGKKTIVLVEAKYRSGKSSEEDEEDRGDNPSPEDTRLLVDQLAREWDNLKKIAERESAEPVLIYLTAHLSRPVEDILSSQKALSSRGQEKADIYWLSWRHLPSLVEKKGLEMLDDLTAILRRMNLTFFEGIHVDALPPVNWSFEIQPMTLDWAFPDYRPEWRFVRGLPGRVDWQQFRAKPIEWRFER